MEPVALSQWGRWVAGPDRRASAGSVPLVLASSMLADLAEQGAPAPADRFSSAQLAVTAIAPALAHGYEHLIARRGDQTVREVRATARMLLSECPRVLATAPTLFLLLCAAWGWWPSRAIGYVPLSVNVVLLYARGLLAARAGGRTWSSFLEIGTADALLGLAVVVANALIKQGRRSPGSCGRLCSRAASDPSEADAAAQPRRSAGTVPADRRGAHRRLPDGPSPGVTTKLAP